MRDFGRSYASLDDARTVQAAVKWYWRVLAFASSWVILAGFLALVPLFDRNPELRISTAALSVVAITLLAAGFSFSALVCFACRSAAFLLEAVLLPCLASCSLSFIVILGSFVVSDRYRWNTPAIISAIVAASSTIIYGILVVSTHRGHVFHFEHLMQSQAYKSPGSGTWPDQESPFIGGPRGYSFHEFAINNESSNYEEMTRQQMLTLLLQREQKTNTYASTRAPSTYRIDLPDEGTDLPISPNPDRLMPPTPISEHTRSKSNSIGTAVSELGPEDATLSNARYFAPPRGAKARLSREERRREIETGR